MFNAIRNVGIRAGYSQDLANDDGGRVTVGATAKADLWQVDYAYQLRPGRPSPGGHPPLRRLDDVNF